MRTEKATVWDLPELEGLVAVLLAALESVAVGLLVAKTEVDLKLVPVADVPRRGRAEDLERHRERV